MKSLGASASWSLGMMITRCSGIMPWWFVVCGLSGSETVCDLAHRKLVSTMCMFFHVRSDVHHPVSSLLFPLHAFGQRCYRFSSLDFGSAL